MIDLTMVSEIRRRPPVIATIPAAARFAAPLRRVMLVAVSCSVVAACAAQPGRISASAVPETAAATAVVADAAAANDATAASAKPVAAAAKPVAIAPRVAVAAGRGARTVGVGLASWYGDRFHGRHTSNGEMFDMEALTAAHPSLPLPSYVRVTNVSNGRSVVVRVNDRGPFHGGRLIDVSRRTADVLGFRASGVGNVKVDYVGPADDGDDRKLIATYQEFGRPAAPEGMQLAALHPVSEAELLGQAPAGAAPATALASAAAPAMAVARASTAMPVGTGVPAAAVAYAAQPVPPAVLALGQPLRSAEPARSAAMQVAALPAKSVPHNAEPQKSEPQKPEPAKVEAAKAGAQVPAKRVVRPAEPVLASSGPVFSDMTPMPAAEAPKPKGGVSARIAASFDGFDAPSPDRDNGSGVAAFSALR